MGKTLAQQAIEQSLIEEAKETDRTGRPRTLAQQAQDQDGRELKRRRNEQLNQPRDKEA